MLRTRGLLVPCVAVVVGAALTGGAESGALEGLVQEFADTRGFHGTVLVESAGRMVLQKSFGLADRSFDVPVRNDTRFWVASITKTFTAVLVLQLREEGRVDLRAPITTYLPDYSGEAGDRITVHSLLNHTSGLRNWETVGSYEQAVREGMTLYQLPHSADELVELASGPLVSEVGSEFAYNNAEYVILGGIVEKVTGSSYEEALRERILAPLGLTNTGLLRQAAIVPDLARTYFQPPGSADLVNDLPVYPENWCAAGGMYSTASDLLAFSDALYEGRLLRPESLDRMLTPGLDGYGYSLWLWDVEVDGVEHRTAERFGSIMGANAALFRLRDDDATIVILANTNTVDMREFAVHIATALIQSGPRRD